VRAAIIGCAGYTGQETLDRVLAHPVLEPVALGSNSLAGRPAAALDPRLARAHLPDFVTHEEALAVDADVVFLCLEHTEAAVFEPRDGAVVVDLSGAHRLRDTSLYPEWYGWEHPRPEGLGDWAYAIPELFPPDGPLVANPGCYATAAILALAPIRDAIDTTSVVVDGKSGVSGAGRAATPKTHFVTVDENVTPYGVGRHRHMPEIEQELGALGAEGVIPAFTPHLLPLDQGELVSCYVTPPTRVDQAELDALFAREYEDEPFVELSARPPGVRDVRDTNVCRIHARADARTRKVFVFAAIDNLWKGASSQAVQNLNLMLGLDETAGIAP
jgi:N-acetyl-gamma-glutamyl-phosphate reductase